MPLDVTAAFRAKKNAQTNQPIWLYTIYDYDGAAGVLRFAERKEDVVFDGNTYTAFPITHDQINESGTGEIDTVKVSIANVNRLVQSYIEVYDWRGKKVTITLVWADDLADANNKVEFDFYIDTYAADAQAANFTLLPKTDTLSHTLPTRIYSRNTCRWVFKSDECGYAGAETTCNKTQQRCKALANYQRFGGFPSIPTRQINVGG